MLFLNIVINILLAGMSVSIAILNLDFKHKKRLFLIIILLLGVNIWISIKMESENLFIAQERDKKIKETLILIKEINKAKEGIKEKDKAIKDILKLTRKIYPHTQYLPELEEYNIIEKNEMRLVQAILEYKLGNLKKAKEICDPLIEKELKLKRLNMFYSTLLFELGFPFEKAWYYLNREIQLFPLDGRAYNQKAFLLGCFMHSHKLADEEKEKICQEIEDCCFKAINNGHKNVNVLKNLLLVGVVKSQLETDKEIGGKIFTNHLKIVESQFPRDELEKLKGGFGYINLFIYDKPLLARKFYYEALCEEFPVDAENINNLLGLANSFYNAGERDFSIKIYTFLADLHQRRKDNFPLTAMPTIQNAYLNLSLYYSSLGKIDKANSFKQTAKTFWRNEGLGFIQSRQNLPKEGKGEKK